jgi:uncharacterized protein YdiU (UPF0061 family)
VEKLNKLSNQEKRE